MNGKPKVSFTFPYRWINDPEDRKYLGQNLIQQIKRSGLKQVYQSSGTDPYLQQHGNPFVFAYQAILKYHCYQPVKIKLTQTQLETYLKPFFGTAKCAAYNTFFVQTNNPPALPVMELELYY